MSAYLHSAITLKILENTNYLNFYIIPINQRLNLNIRKEEREENLPK